MACSKPKTEPLTRNLTLKNGSGARLSSSGLDNTSQWQVGNKFPAWALAARIVFALSPNSASCERVFALLKRMYSEEQLSSLADAISTSLMLAYNARRIG